MREVSVEVDGMGWDGMGMGIGVDQGNKGTMGCLGRVCAFRSLGRWTT